MMLVAKMLGHASPKMTLDIYADLFDSHADSVTDAVEVARAARQSLQLRAPNG